MALDYSDGDAFKQLAMLLGLVFFVSLMIFDACVAICGKPARIWNSGKYLIINALTIQILSYLKVKTLKFSEGGEDSDDCSKICQEFLQNVFVGGPGRVVMCVLIGYLLPGMARAGAATDWRTLAALVLSIFTSEYYYLKTPFHAWRQLTDCIHKLRKGNGTELSLNSRLWTLVINYSKGMKWFIMVSITLMVLFSICAIFAGRTIRSMFAQRISVIQWDKSKKKEAESQWDKSNKSEESSWEKFEGEIVESWFLARVCNPQYVIGRSVLSSAAGLLISICIPFLGLRQSLSFQIYLPLIRENNILLISWTFEWAFIVIGGIVIFCRWFTAVVYFPRLSVKNVKLRRCTRLFVEDFWTRSILELVQMYKLQRWRPQEQSKDGMFKGLALPLATTMKIHYFLYLLWPLQVSLVCFSKCCFFISELLFSFKIVWNCLLGSSKASSQSKREFEEYKKILKKVCMPGENPESLWLANEKSLNQAKTHFNESKKKGYKCEKLFEFIMPRLHLESSGDGRFVNQLERSLLVAGHFPLLGENSMRMTAVSLLTVIDKLLPLQKNGDRLTKAIEAYQQAFDLMSFVDNSDLQQPTTIDVLKVIDIEADRVSVAVSNVFQRLLKLRKKKIRSSKKSPNLSAPEATPERDFKAAIKELQENAEEELKAQKLAIINKDEQSARENQTVGGEEQTVGEEYCDSRDWSGIAASYSNYRVCKLILSRHFDDENELMDYLFGFLADVIGHCLLKLPNVLVKKCREWAVQFEEEKIWDAMFIAGKLVGVVQKYNEVEGNFPEPMLPTYTYGEIQTVFN